MDSQTKIDPATSDPKQSFADGLADILLKMVKSADILGVSCTVTGAAGSVPVTGTASQSNTVHPV